MLKERPLPAFRSATNTDLFVTYRGKAGRRADRHHQRPPTGQPLAADGPTDWRPVTADRLATPPTPPTDWRRLAAVSVTSKGPAKDQ